MLLVQSLPVADIPARFEVIRERAPQASTQQGFAWQIVTSAERPSVSSGGPLRQSMCDDMDEQPRSSEHDQQDFVGHCFSPMPLEPKIVPDHVPHCRMPRACQYRFKNRP